MRLNYQLTLNPNNPQKVMVFIHGLFGSLSNLGMLARHYAKDYTIFQLDVRNHGLSAHSDEHHYEILAQDVLETLTELNIEKFAVVGHSMGGKIAMKVASLVPDRVTHLVVLDMSPAPYTENHHAEIFQALFAVERANVSSRLDAAKIMRDYMNEEMVIQFLLKSFNKEQWLFNVAGLYDNYANILAWDNIQPIAVPSLFLRGGNSFYISEPAQFTAIEAQFTQAQVELIADAGHWLHGEKTVEVLEKMDAFLQTF